MELYECEDAVHEALRQRRPQLIVGIINKAGAWINWVWGRSLCC